MNKEQVEEEEKKVEPLNRANKVREMHQRGASRCS